ncbi:steroid 17-alpha-hydroxylase 17,20 lyase-like [Paramuricea clavata]|uniref:Steroid 17-alpha-hydroxylase 17,20 lyase-like n=1 Tax=Paramuricea clavata TaxID=317549 RepID=A0A6S7J7X3_PARCT|nr:steroid 17-alpha-hydroxylase 17,20 lyase-like [Paramuricea clavata]
MMIVEVAVSLLLIWTIWYISKTCIKKQGMPPGPFPFPWIGNIPHVISDQVFPFRKLSKEYGEIFTVFMPNGTFVVLNTASLARNARLGTKDDIPEEIEKCQSFSPNKLVQSTIFAQVWEWLTSKKINIDDPIISLFNEMQEIIMNLPREISIYLLIPILGYITNNFNHKLERAKDIRKQLFAHEFSAHRETYTPGVIRDLTDSFISAYEKEISNGTSKDIGSIEDIPDLMLDVVVAGIDTASTTICWFILYTTLHQDIQAKLHKELMTCYRWLSYSKEYERPHKCYEIHHDPKEWPEPNEFKPERFLDSDGKFVGWTTKHAFMPFGLGRRECLGQLFGKILMFTFASTLLHLYKIELPEGAEKPSTSPIGLHFHHPKDFTVVAKKRH